MAIEIPNKKYFMIGEVAKLCDVKTHVLRYWEGQFPQLKPSKRRGRRYYQREDVLLILEINNLLNQQRFTVEGAVARLNERRSSSAAVKPDAKTLQTESNLQSSAVITEQGQQKLDLLELVGAIKLVIKENKQFQQRLRETL